MTVNFNNVYFEKSVGNLRQFPSDKLPEIVFSGKSNVGKSSLINKILNRKSLARVSTKPGKTININLYNVKQMRFVDLPGYGYAKVSFSEKKRWSDLVESYFNFSKNISLVVQIIDVRHSPSVLDFQMMDYLYFKKFPFIIVSSKVDKLNKTQRLNRTIDLRNELEKYIDISNVIFSSATGEGIENIKSIILSSLNSK